MFQIAFLLSLCVAMTYGFSAGVYNGDNIFQYFNSYGTEIRFDVYMVDGKYDDLRLQKSHKPFKHSWNQLKFQYYLETQIGAPLNRFGVEHRKNVQFFDKNTLRKSTPHNDAEKAVNRNWIENPKTGLPIWKSHGSVAEFKFVLINQAPWSLYDTTHGDYTAEKLMELFGYSNSTFYTDCNSTDAGAEAITWLVSPCFIEPRSFVASTFGQPGFQARHWRYTNQASNTLIGLVVAIGVLFTVFALISLAAPAPKKGGGNPTAVSTDTV